MNTNQTNWNFIQEGVDYLRLLEEKDDSLFEAFDSNNLLEFNYKFEENIVKYWDHIIENKNTDLDNKNDTEYDPKLYNIENQIMNNDHKENLANKSNININEEQKEPSTTPSDSKLIISDKPNEHCEDISIKIDEIPYLRRSRKRDHNSSFNSLMEIAEEERIKHWGKFKRFGKKEDRGELCYKMNRIDIAYYEK